MTKFRKLLKEKDITGAQVARRIGVDQATVNSWAIDRTKPSFNNVVKVSKVLNVSVETIVLCFCDDETTAEDPTPAMA